MKHPRPRGRAHPILASATLGVLLAACLIGWFNWKVSPLLRAYAATELETQVTRLVNEGIAQDIEEGTVDYTSILVFEKNEAGEITALKSDLGEANRLRSRVISGLAAGLAKEEYHTFGIPVGNLTGISLFSGRGFRVPVKVISVSTVSAAFRSSLTPAAVNQTHYKLELDISVQMSLLIPGGVYSIPVDTTVTVGEAVLLGQVPESYTVFDNYTSVEDAAEDYYNYG